ncbi:hypothetical protein HBI26_022830 [Parastagonospora nodorum]|nr:hypothetical protein HBI32_028130 [Parastagonospora nodorum]KAH5610511.1 hypothetical protein HBI26_022830 [Parastagonospora nodorum]KAH6492134.1 hypothetical protein HBI55_136110 [Parastagonospora nodorum]
MVAGATAASLPARVYRDGRRRKQTQEASRTQISLSHGRIRSELVMDMIVRGQSMGNSDTALSLRQGMKTRSQRRSRLPAKERAQRHFSACNSHPPCSAIALCPPPVQYLPHIVCISSLHLAHRQLQSPFAGPYRPSLLFNMRPSQLQHIIPLQIRPVYS